MTRLLEKAIKSLRRLPEDEQDRFARDLLLRIEEEERWNALVSSPASQDWLERQAEKTRNEIAAGKTVSLDCGKKQ